ncbi:DUF6297 family protein [Cutibacterium granulosum]|uniref:DUF6297 family protein n=1 Tax=Cutibacterium granulosum TaxID=33011 RepID=UPI0030B8E67F
MSRHNRHRRSGGKTQSTSPTAATPAPKDVPTVSDVPAVTLVVSHSPDEYWQGQADERQLELLMGDWRRGRTTRNIWQALGDAYVLLFSLAIILAMLISLIVQAQGQAAGCSSSGCQAARNVLPLAVVTAVMGFALAVSRIFGPVLASAAEGFWLFDAPVDRSRFLRKRLRIAEIVSLVGGAIAGALVSALSGLSARAIIAWTVATGLSAAALVAFAAAEQGAERVRTVRVLQSVAMVLAGLLLLALVSTATGWYPMSISTELSVLIAWSVVAGAVLVLIVALVVANGRLNSIRRARLMSGGSLVSGMQGAAFALDFALIRDILQEREAVERGQVRATRGRGMGLHALVWRDVQRLLRFPKPLVTLAATIVVPYALQALGLGRLTSPLSALVLVAAMVPFFTSLRVLSRTKGLMRMMPFTTSQVRTAASIVPAILALVWALATIPAFHGIGDAARMDWFHAVLHALVTAAAGFIGAIRWVSAKPADYSTPMVATQAGAMPPSLMFNLLRGLDMVALITIWLVLGLSPWIGVVAAILAYSFLRMGGLDQQELQQMQEESRRQLAEQKRIAQNERPVRKKVVRR